MWKSPWDTPYFGGRHPRRHLSLSLIKGTCVPKSWNGRNSTNPPPPLLYWASPNPKLEGWNTAYCYVMSEFLHQVWFLPIDKHSRSCLHSSTIYTNDDSWALKSKNWQHLKNKRTKLNSLRSGNKLFRNTPLWFLPIFSNTLDWLDWINWKLIRVGFERIILERTGLERIGLNWTISLRRLCLIHT